MFNSKLPENANTNNLDRRWQDLYRIGAVSCIIVVILLIFAVIAFLIWPFSVGVVPTTEIFTLLQTDRLGGLMSLDPLLLLIELITILPLLALYAALKDVNESFALIALVVGLLAVVLVVPARPLAELVWLSDQYAAATTEAARTQYLAAGETLLSLFNGTGWMVFTVFLGISGLISSLLMLRSQHFNKTTAYVGIVSSLPQFGFFIPVVGPLLLLLTTIGGMIWYILIARTFFGLGWNK